LADVESNGYVLTPGRFVGAEDEKDDGVPFEEKFLMLKNRLEAQFTEGRTLETSIKENLRNVVIKDD